MFTKKYLHKMYGFDGHHIDMIESEYHRFMKLRSENESLNPSEHIDKYWQTHIINTVSYMNYYDEKFGKFVHHYPKILSHNKVCDTLKEYEMKFVIQRYGT